MGALDLAAEAMAGGGEAAGLRFYQVLADAELLLLLEDEAGTDSLRPRVFELSDGPVLLAFDSEERLAAMSGGVALAYAALPGRVIAGMMEGRGLSLGLNLGSGAASETVLPPDALSWLCQMLPRDVAFEAVAPLGYGASELAPAAIDSLRIALSGAGPLITGAGVLRVLSGQDAQEVVVLFGAPEIAEEALARAVSEAASFAGLAADALAVQFLPEPSALAPALSGHLRMIDLPPPETRAEPAGPVSPGMDPDRPPRLRYGVL